MIASMFGTMISFDDLIRVLIFISSTLRTMDLPLSNIIHVELEDKSSTLATTTTLFGLHIQKACNAMKMVNLKGNFSRSKSISIDHSKLQYFVSTMNNLADPLLVF